MFRRDSGRGQLSEERRAIEPQLDHARTHEHVDQRAGCEERPERQLEIESFFAARGRKFDLEIPFGPFLATGCLLYMFAGPELLDWWFI